MSDAKANGDDTATDGDSVDERTVTAPAKRPSNPVALDRKAQLDLARGRMAKAFIAQCERNNTSEPSSIVDKKKSTPITAPATESVGDTFLASQASPPVLDIQKQKAAFAAIKSARGVFSNPRRLSKSTERDYRSKADRLRGRLSDPSALDPDEWIKLLAPHALSGKAFRHYRAALTWALQFEGVASLKRQDQLQRAGNRGAEWLEEVQHLQQLEAVYVSVQSVDKTDLQTHGDHACPRNRGTRKKEDLKIISAACPSWLSRILLAMRRSAYLDAVRVLARVGCRPEELISGVRIESGGGECVRFVIQGAKVTENAGQTWRQIELPLERIPSVWIERLEREGAFDIRIATKDGLRSALRRASQRVLPELPAVTAYVMRHSIAQEAREDGWSAEEIGALLGHSVADTPA